MASGFRIGVVSDQASGVQAEQVVEAVTVLRVLQQHVRFEQLLEDALGLGGRQAEQDPAAVGTEIVAGVEAAQPERALGAGSQVGVAELEAVEHAGLAEAQFREPAVAVGEAAGQVGDGPLAAGREAPTGDTQCEGKPGAGLGEGRDVLRAVRRASWRWT